MTNKQQIGDYGEQLAVHYLQEHGYTIRDRQWRCRLGEIDIVAERDDEIAFVEVKARQSQSLDDAYAAFTPAKTKKMVTAAHHYIAAHKLDGLWRIDAIVIAIRDGLPPLIEHVEDALGW